MIRLSLKAILTITTAFLFLTPAPAKGAYPSKLNKADTEAIMQKMFSAINELKSIRYTFDNSERIEGKIMSKTSEIKLQTKPRYIYVNLGKKEVLWLQGKNNNKAIINTGTFPFISLHLDPMGSIMRKGQHHTINELGFDYIGSIVKHSYNRFNANFEHYFSIYPDKTFNNRPCYELVITVPEFKWIKYTVKQGETILSISKKKYISEYMVIEKNPTVNWLTGLKTGQTILIPNSYAKVTKIFIDKEYMLPVYNTMIDEQGLFESYKYTNIRVNSKIGPEEFTEDYKDYDF